MESVLAEELPILSHTNWLLLCKRILVEVIGTSLEKPIMYLGFYRILRLQLIETCLETIATFLSPSYD